MVMTLLHILAATVLLGCCAYGAMAPATSGAPEVRRRAGRQARWIGATCLLVLVITGSVALSVWHLGPGDLLTRSVLDTPFGHRIALKAVGTATIAGLLFLGTGSRGRWWLQLGIAILVILISIRMIR